MTADIRIITRTSVIEGMAIGGYAIDGHRRPTTTFAANSWASPSRARVRLAEAYAGRLLRRKHSRQRSGLRLNLFIGRRRLNVAREEEKRRAAPNPSKASQGKQRFKPRSRPTSVCSQPTTINNTRFCVVPAIMRKGAVVCRAGTGEFRWPTVISRLGPCDQAGNLRFAHGHSVKDG